MKRLALVTSAVLGLLSGVLLARAAWPADPGAPASPTPVVSAAGALDGPAGWHYRHSQPTHWRAAMLQQ